MEGPGRGVVVKTLREVLEEAELSRVAVGHFNFSDLVTLRAVTTAARELAAPVLVGVSRGRAELPWSAPGRGGRQGRSGRTRAPRVLECGSHAFTGEGRGRGPERLRRDHLRPLRAADR